MVPTHTRRVLLCALLITTESSAFSYPSFSTNPLQTRIPSRQQPSTSKLLPAVVSQNTELRAIAPGLASTVASFSSLPLPAALCLTCLLPTSLGYYRQEYGVSYGYGLAVSLSAFAILQRLTANTTPAIALSHIYALIFYGVRLCLFLLYRELTIPRFTELREKIEASANAKGGRLARTPFIVSCALLYGGLVAPTLLTSAYFASSAASFAAGWRTAIATCIGVSWVGFLTAALGDLTKSWVKASSKENKLVTSGIFALLRHPNYTGETVGWSFSALAGFLSALALTLHTGSSKSLVLGGLSLLSFVGAAGINFVLCQATTGLEKRQKETYGGETDTKTQYENWVAKTWGGFTL